MNDVLAGYAAAATPDLIARYESFDPQSLYAPVLDLFPTLPARILDVGAGTGRDAAWLARKGHIVVAVEPVAALREAGNGLHGSTDILWLDEALPELTRTREKAPFGLITLNGVWQHLDDAARSIALDVLGGLTADGGLLIFSLRHGPSPAGRRAFPIDPDRMIEAAARSHLSLQRRSETHSIQIGNRAMGVHWTWLAFRKDGA
jgi:SAM-dependent methyltransferase